MSTRQNRVGKKARTCRAFLLGNVNLIIDKFTMHSFMAAQDKQAL